MFYIALSFVLDDSMVLGVVLQEFLQGEKRETKFHTAGNGDLLQSSRCCICMHDLFVFIFAAASTVIFQRPGSSNSRMKKDVA